MLYWMCSKTRRDRIRNDTLRESVMVIPILENRLRWFEHIERTLVVHVVRRVD